VAESLRKQIINSIRELVAEIGLTVDTDSLSFRETEFTLLKAVLQDAGILPIFHASESQELRIKKCYKAFADDRDIIIANNSMSLLEQQINYLKQIAIYEGITADYNVSSSQLLRKLKLFNAVRGSLSGPCLTNAVAWHVLKQVQELSGGVWGIPDKLGDAAKYVKVVGQPYAQFDGVAYGLVGDISSLETNDFDRNFAIRPATLSVTSAVYVNQVQAKSAEGLTGYYLRQSSSNQFQLLIATSTTDLAIITSSTIIEAGKRYNVNIRKEGTTASIIVDGVVNSETVPFNINYTTTGTKGTIAAGVYLGSTVVALWTGDFFSADNYTFSESQGATVYDTENGNDLTLINATLGNSGQVGDFWQYSDDATRKPEALLNGCFKRDDNGALVPKGVDTSGMTGTEIQPFDWLNLPYTILYPADAWADDMDKDNTTNWEASGLPAGREWSYEQLNNIPILKKDPIENSIFNKDGRLDELTKEVFISTGQAGDCLDKTEKWAKDPVLKDENEEALYDEFGDKLLS